MSEKVKKSGKVKLTATQVGVLDTIKERGECYFSNNQNPTAKKLISLGICDWNSRYDALVFTEFGKKYLEL